MMCTQISKNHSFPMSMGWYTGTMDNLTKCVPSSSHSINTTITRVLFMEHYIHINKIHVLSNHMNQNNHVQMFVVTLISYPMVDHFRNTSGPHEVCIIHLVQKVGVTDIIYWLNDKSHIKPPRHNISSLSYNAFARFCNRIHWIFNA